MASFRGIAVFLIGAIVCYGALFAGGFAAAPGAILSDAGEFVVPAREDSATVGTPGGGSADVGRTGTPSTDGTVMTGTAGSGGADRGRTDFAETAVVVAVRNRADPSRNVTAAVEAALAYWESHPEYGRYDATFRLRPNAPDPDVVVWYNRSVDCDGPSATGCAPRLDDGQRVRTPVNVRIEYNRSRNFRRDVHVITHEFGHVLGIGHCAEPLWVMGHASYCAGEPVSLVDATARASPWRDTTLRVFVDVSGVPEGERERTRDQIGHAIEYFRDGAAGHVSPDLSLVLVEDPYLADIRIAAAPDCPRSETVCYRWWGSDPDGDGAFEYYTEGRIVVVTDDVDARGWHAGWALAGLLTPGDLPPAFVDPTYAEVRSDWWNED